MTYPSGKPKRKRGQNRPASTFRAIIMLSVPIVLAGIAMILVIRSPDTDQDAESAFSVTPSPATEAPASAICSQGREWVPFTWLDLNLTPPLQEQFSGLDNIDVQVFGQGERCLRLDELIAPEYRTFQTDFYFTVQVDAADLGEPGSLEDGELLDKLGSLTLLILRVMDDYLDPANTPGENPGTVHITFTAGDRWRTLRFSVAQVARAPIFDFVELSAVTGALGGLSDLVIR